MDPRPVSPKPDLWRWARNPKRLWLQVHGWTGLILGFPLALIGLTGSLFLLMGPLTELQYGPILSRPAALAQVESSASTWMAAAERSYGPNFRVEGFAVPRSEVFGADTVLFLGRDYGEPSPTQYFIAMDPVSHETVARFPSSSSIAVVAARLHQSLLLPVVGRDAVALLGIVLLGSALSGLYLWWPLPGRWKSAFWVRKRARGAGKLRDWHAVGAIYMSAILLGLGLTGVWLTKPEWFGEEPAGPPPIRGVGAASCAPVDSFANALRRVEAAYPSAKITTARSFGAQTQTGFEVGLRLPGDLDGRDGDRAVTIESACGSLTPAEEPSAGNLLSRLAGPTHGGRILGPIGVVLVFVSGLALPALYVTGLAMWLIKRRRPRVTKPQAATSPMRP